MQRNRMVLTQLDSNAAVVRIDLQKGFVARTTADPAMEIVECAARLAQAFRKRGLQVVLVNVEGRLAGRTQAGIPNRDLPANEVVFPRLGEIDTAEDVIEKLKGLQRKPLSV